MTRKLGWLALGGSVLLGLGCGLGEQVDTDAPLVAFLAPRDGETVFGQVLLQAAADDGFGVARVTFFVDGVMLADDQAAPYEVFWVSNGVADGPHVLLARAEDFGGNSGTDEITVTVNNAKQ